MCVTPLAGRWGRGARCCDFKNYILPVRLRESLIEDGLWSVVTKKPEVGLVELVELPACLHRHRTEPVRLPAARCQVPLRGGELHHIVHPQQAQQVLGILLCRFQVAHKVVLDLARVAEAVHLPPVLVEGHVLLGLRVKEVLGEVGEGWAVTQSEGLVHGGGRRGLIGVAAQHDLCKVPVEVLVAHLKFVPVGGDETHKRVPHEQELCVLLQLHLPKVVPALF